MQNKQKLMMSRTSKKALMNKYVKVFLRTRTGNKNLPELLYLCSSVI